MKWEKRSQKTERVVVNRPVAKNFKWEGRISIGKAHVYKFLFFDLKIDIFSYFSLPIGAALRVRAWLENLMAFSVHLFQREMNKYW
jgi:hypothetical protein